jgi:hypothetical protein
MRTATLAVLLVLGGCAVTNKLSWRIEGREVSREEFERRMDALQNAGGWYCAETTTGGRTGWKVQDPQGAVFQYTATTDGDRQSFVLERLP